MNVNPDALRLETLKLLKKVDEEMEFYMRESQRLATTPFQVANFKGHCGYGELVNAKMLALNTLATLNKKK